MREIVSPLSGIRSPFGGRVDPYKVIGFKPTLVADMTRDYYRNTSRQSFDDIFTHSRLGNATMVDSDGLLKWAPHNLLTYSEDFSNAAWNKINTASVTANSTTAPDGTETADTINLPATFDRVRRSVTVSAVNHTFGIWLKGTSGETVAITADETTYVTVTLTGHWQFEEITNSATDAVGVFRTSGLTATTVYVWGAHLYRSDLGGMAPVPLDARVAGSATYVPTTSTAKYLPRRHNHVYNGSAWVDAGTLIEAEARTQLLHTTNALVTQSHTVTAVPHTLHFTGTGTVTLSGASTAGPLVGTGTGEENRVSLTFTPTAGILILIVSGTVTDAQLEVGSTPSSYTPNLAASGTVTRAAETLTIPSAKLPYSATAMSIQMQGRMTYADEGKVAQVFLTRWLKDSSNKIFTYVKSDGANVGKVLFEQTQTGIIDALTSGEVYSPDILVPFNIASRHGSTFINGAVDGTALTADLTPVALPDLSGSDLQIGYDFMGNIEQVRLWVVDIGDTGIAEASS